MSETQKAPVINGQSVTTLQIGEEFVIVTTKSGSESAERIVLSMGSVKTAKYFRHSPPTEAEMETAIQLVEDELIRHHHSIVKGAVLTTTDASVRNIAWLGGVDDRPDLTLTIELVEKTFNRLAAIVQGRPTSLDSIPTTAEFSATLLILREFMHHLEFASIDIRP